MHHLARPTASSSVEIADLQGRQLAPPQSGADHDDEQVPRVGVDAVTEQRDLCLSEDLLYVDQGRSAGGRSAAALAPAQMAVIARGEAHSARDIRASRACWERRIVYPPTLEPWRCVVSVVVDEFVSGTAWIGISAFWPGRCQPNELLAGRHSLGSSEDEDRHAGVRGRPRRSLGPGSPGEVSSGCSMVGK